MYSRRQPARHANRRFEIDRKGRKPDGLCRIATQEVKVFTVAEANAMLPLVRAIVRDIGAGRTTCATARSGSSRIRSGQQ